MEVSEGCRRRTNRQQFSMERGFGEAQVETYQRVRMVTHPGPVIGT